MISYLIVGNNEEGFAKTEEHKAVNFQKEYVLSVLCLKYSCNISQGQSGIIMK